MRRSALVAVCCLLALGACGGDDGNSSATTIAPRGVTSTTAAKAATGTAPQYAAAIAVAIRADEGFSSVAVADAQCAAQGVVDAVGVRTLRELGISPAQIREEQRLPQLEGNLDATQATAVTDALLRCIDFGRVLATQIQAGSGTQITDEQVACINERIEGNPDVRAALAQAYTRDVEAEPDEPVDIIAIATQCVPLPDAPGGTTPTT